MKMRAAVLYVGMLAVLSLQTSLSQTNMKLALDATKPIVYIEFDHAGSRRPVQDGEPPKGLWLRLVNNSAVPIVVQANSTSTDPAMTILPDTITAVRGKIPKSGPVRQRMPSGYASDTGTPLIIEPGRSLLFSVPANHVSPAWSMQVPFQFSLPAVKQGSEPLCLAELTWDDLPTSSRTSLSREMNGHTKGTSTP
jgi:hypothetical protein